MSISLAPAATAAAASATLTAAGCAPDAVLGVYSLGIVLYELLTGRVPFVGESAGEILMKHLSEKPDLSPIPRRLRLPELAWWIAWARRHRS